MSDRFKAWLATETEGGRYTVALTELGPEDLPAGDVVVDVAYSTVNYKDALAMTGRGKIIRSFPMIPGIDLAGTVRESASADWKPGDRVLVNGYGLSERFWGAYTPRARLKAEWLVRVPEAFDLAQTMAIGTAGYTAMLCVLALEEGGVRPEGREVLVTGAAGGVGSVAVALLARLGYRVVASTGRPETRDYLRELGAVDFLDRADLAGEGPPLARERWGGVVDCVGSRTLANALAQTAYGGTVAACGLAGGMDLPTSVAPFILRGVRLIGIDSVMAPRAAREQAWARLARDLDPESLARMTSTVPFGEIPRVSEDLLANRVRGRVVVDVNG